MANLREGTYREGSDGVLLRKDSLGIRAEAKVEKKN